MTIKKLVTIKICFCVHSKITPYITTAHKQCNKPIISSVGWCIYFKFRPRFFKETFLRSNKEIIGL